VGNYIFKDENSDMKSIFLALILIAATAPAAMAQEVPAIEGSASYIFSPKPASYNGDLSHRLNRQGWSGSFVGNFDDVFGLEFNASGSYGRAHTGVSTDTVAIHGLMGGPRFTWRETPRIAPFGRFLVGTVHRKVSGVGDFDLAAQAGGGITLFTGSRFGIVTGGDYRRNWHGLRWDDFTVHVGISFRKKSEE